MARVMPKAERARVLRVRATAAAKGAPAFDAKASTENKLLGMQVLREVMHKRASP